MTDDTAAEIEIDGRAFTVYVKGQEYNTLEEVQDCAFECLDRAVEKLNEANENAVEMEERLVDADGSHDSRSVQ